MDIPRIGVENKALVPYNATESMKRLSLKRKELERENDEGRGVKEKTKECVLGAKT